MPKGAELASLKEDRVETKGRFYTKVPPEADLALTQQRLFRTLYPELEAERQEESERRSRETDGARLSGHRVPSPSAGGGDAAWLLRPSQVLHAQAATVTPVHAPQRHTD